MLQDVLDALACPHCGGDLFLVERTLRCPDGHAFDVARQGYVSLVSGHTRVIGDSAEMVAARADFLAAGHFDPLADLVADEVGRDIEKPGRVLDLGAGTGDYLARVLQRSPDQDGIALDVSKHACRRAAKAHPLIGAVVADAWTALPLHAGSVSTVMNIFAPRNAEEMHRVLAPGGRLVVVTPTARHLGALVSGLDLLSVDERKQERLDDQLAGRFTLLRKQLCEFSMELGHDDVEAVVGMGPSAWHAEREALRERIDRLPVPFTVMASVSVAVFEPV